MKSYTVVSLVFGCALWTYAQACEIEIENERPTSVGADKGVTGQCPNGSGEVTCTFDAGEGWTCDGPDGSYSGAVKGETAAYACGGCD